MGVIYCSMFPAQISTIYLTAAISAELSRQRDLLRFVMHSTHDDFLSGGENEG
jgi:hypothetical protein